MPPGWPATLGSCSGRPEPGDSATGGRDPQSHLPAGADHDQTAPPTSPGDLATRVTREAQEASRFIRLVTGSSVAPLAMDQVRADIRRLARCFVSHPVAEVFGEIRDLRREVTAAIAHNKHPDQLRDLHLAASRLSGLSAHVCLDVGDYASADTHARAAWLGAELAGHTGMQAWVRALQSLIAYWGGPVESALAAAQDGQRYAHGGTVAVRLLSLQARAYARLGRQRETLNALATADDARGRRETEEDVGGLFTFPEAKQATYAGTALLALGRGDLMRRAIHESRRALKLYQASAPPDRSTGDLLAARFDLAAAHTADNDLDSAECELTHILAATPGQRTASIIRRGRALDEQLAQKRFGISAQAKLMRQRIAAFAINQNTVPGRDVNV